MMTDKEINSWINFISSFDVDYSCTVMFERRFSRRKRTMRFRDEVIKFLKIFMTQLNVHFYGVKSTKKTYVGERLLIIPVIEHWTSDDKDLHFHFFIGNFPTTDIDDISLRVKHSWSKVPRSEKKENSVLIEKTWYKDGWSSYITKELKFKNIDCVLTDLIQTTC
jgi:hypothetical protein